MPDAPSLKLLRGASLSDETVALLVRQNEARRREENSTARTVAYYDPAGCLVICDEKDVRP